jgi:hypothetical protein
MLCSAVKFSFGVSLCFVVKFCHLILKLSCLYSTHSGVLCCVFVLLMDVTFLPLRSVTFILYSR